MDRRYTKPFRDIGPISVKSSSGTYTDLATWTGIALESPPCRNVGFANPRFPVYLESYNITAQRQAYDVFAWTIHENANFSNSLFMFEGFSKQGVRTVHDRLSSFAYRGDNLLAAPLITYKPADVELDRSAKVLGERLRSILQEGTGRKEMHVYVNYAYGDETKQQWYGGDKCRQGKLSALKQKFDPDNRFGFYAPLA